MQRAASAGPWSTVIWLLRQEVRAAPSVMLGEGVVAVKTSPPLWRGGSPNVNISIPASRFPPSSCQPASQATSNHNGEKEIVRKPPKPSYTATAAFVKLQQDLAVGTTYLQLCLAEVKKNNN